MNLPFGGENITQVVETPAISDPVQGTEEYECAVMRDASTRTITAMPWLPQLPDEWATELYERITEAERTYAAPNLQSSDYEIGTATEPDEVAEVGHVGLPGYLFSAEHATSPVSWQTHEVRFPDAGTGGLAAVLAEDYGTALIMRGRQTSNLPSDPEHRLRPYIRRELVHATGYLSVHGKAPGMFVHPTDRAEIHGCIGLGLGPTEAMREFARKVALAAKDDLGLYVVISNDQKAYIQKRGDTALKRLEDGSPKLSQLAALKPTMAATFSRQMLAELGRSIPTMQMELTNLLRATALDDENVKDRKSRIMGVAMGYKLLEKVVQLTPEFSAEAA